jgi:hypothetical protein
MIKELLDAGSLFSRTDGLIDELIGPLCQRYGLTQEIWDKEVAAYRAEALKRMNGHREDAAGSPSTVATAAASIR